MQPIYELYTDLYYSKGLSIADSFLERYESCAIGETTTYGFRDKSAAVEALQFLHELGFKGNLQISFEYSEEEIAEYPAFSLVPFCEYDVLINDRVNSKVARQYDIVEDCHSGMLVTSPKFKEVIEGEVPEAVWKPLASKDGRHYFSFEISAELPEPIYLPEPREITAGKTPGVFFVANDGRGVITPQSIDSLGSFGMAYTRTEMANGIVYNTIPSLAVTGKILHKLIANRITGFGYPAHPYLTEDNPLSK